MEKHQPIVTYIAGFLLIALGLKFMGVINIKSIELLGFVMMIFGISYVFLSFGRNKKGVLFTSSVIFLSGVLIYLLNNFEFFNTSSLLYPCIMFIFGVSFLMLYIDGDIGVAYLFVSIMFLILGVILTLLKGNFKGSSFFTTLIKVFTVYWPVIFIVVIVYFLVLRIENRNKKNSEL